MVGEVETVEPAARLSNLISVEPSSLTRAYLFLLLVLLPTDYFGPTAALFREGGARPAIPLMVLGSCWIVYRHWRWFLVHTLPFWRTTLLIFATVCLLGTIAFGVNVALEISYWDGTKSPPFQFVSQAILFALVAPVLIAHAWLFSQPGVGRSAVRVLPHVVSVHLAAIVLQAAGVLQEHRFPLSMFRGYVARDTSNGLMTEPSYVGAMAGMYGLALMVCMPEHKIRNRFLGALPMLAALHVGGKTLIPALLSGTLGFAYQARAKVLSLRTLVIAAVVGGMGYYVIVSRAALDVRDNLSSAMRFGSTLLAYNVARAGYGVAGIGFGQFHFVFRPKYAPWFLSYSTEAIAAFEHSSSMRASTFNLPIRFLVETGVLGLLLTVIFVYLLFRRSRAHDDLTHRIGAVIAASSLGFLMTQDPYFFPAFVLGASMMAASSLPLPPDPV